MPRLTLATTACPRVETAAAHRFPAPTFERPAPWCRLPPPVPDGLPRVRRPTVGPVPKTGGGGIGSPLHCRVASVPTACSLRVKRADPALRLAPPRPGLPRSGGRPFRRSAAAKGRPLLPAPRLLAPGGRRGWSAAAQRFLQPVGRHASTVSQDRFRAAEPPADRFPARVPRLLHRSPLLARQRQRQRQPTSAHRESLASSPGH